VGVSVAIILILYIQAEAMKKLVMPSLALRISEGGGSMLEMSH
jgi:hypothetical protein